VKAGPEGGWFTFRVRDKHTRKLKSEQRIHNTITDYAKDLMLSCALTGTWYVGLIRTFDEDDENISVPPFDPIVLNELDWQEYTRYTGQRKPWNPVIEADPVRATSDPVEFVGFNEAMCPMAGAFLARTASKGSGYDTVFSFAGGGPIVTLDDIVEIEYDITI